MLNDGRYRGSVNYCCWQPYDRPHPNLPSPAGPIWCSRNWHQVSSTMGVPWMDPRWLSEMLSSSHSFWNLWRGSCFSLGRRNGNSHNRHKVDCSLLWASQTLSWKNPNLQPEIRFLSLQPSSWSCQRLPPTWDPFLHGRLMSGYFGASQQLWQCILNCLVSLPECIWSWIYWDQTVISPKVISVYRVSC